MGSRRSKLANFECIVVVLLVSSISSCTASTAFTNGYCSCFVTTSKKDVQFYSTPLQKHNQNPSPIFSVLVELDDKSLSAQNRLKSSHLQIDTTDCVPKPSQNDPSRSSSKRKNTDTINSLKRRNRGKRLPLQRLRRRIRLHNLLKRKGKERKSGSQILNKKIHSVGKVRCQTKLTSGQTQLRNSIDDCEKKNWNSDLKNPISSLSSDDLRQWAATDVHTLRLMFGTNQNKFWGDLDNETARRLYHTLLPRSLISLYKQGLPPDELAPLAFKARQAAKEYVRERCHVPGRIFARVYDGFRHLKVYGNWSSKGMTWEEIWYKYELEVREDLLQLSGNDNPTFSTIENSYLSTKVCLKILERSCITNKRIDQLILTTKEENGEEKMTNLFLESNIANHDKEAHAQKNGEDLIIIATKFERDIIDLMERREVTPFYALTLLLSTRRKLLILQRWIGEDDVTIFKNDLLVLPSLEKSKSWDVQVKNTT